MHDFLQVRAMVLDSPFQDFWVLAMELVSKIEIKVPSVAISMVKMLIRNSTKSRANVDMDKLSPISGIHTCVIVCVIESRHQSTLGCYEDSCFD